MIFSFNLVRSFVIQPFMKSLFIIELNIACKHYDNNSDKRLSIISLSSIEMCIHLMWYYKDVNKSQFDEVKYYGIQRFI